MPGLTDLVLAEHVAVNLSAGSSESIIRSLSALLEASGAVRSGYAEACVAREEEHPTGLPTPGMAVAIPHADPDLVERAAIAVAIPDRPVAFAQMGDPAVELQAGAVFLLALPDAQGQLSALRRVATFVQDPDRLQALVAAGTPDEVVAVFTAFDQEINE